MSRMQSLQCHYTRFTHTQKGKQYTQITDYQKGHKIKTHNSESRGQEEAGRMRRTSELFTGSTALKLVNALNKPPLKLSFSYQGLSTF